MSNRKSGGGLFSFLVGIAAGAAAGYYLSTEEGRRMRQKLTERTSELSTEAAKYARETGTQVNENLQEVMTSSKKYVNDLTESVKHRVDDLGTSAKSQVDRTSSSFQEGIARGKAKLEKQKEEIDSLLNKNGKA